MEKIKLKTRKREQAARENLHRMIQAVDTRHRQAVEQEKKILVSATHRLDAVNAEIDGIKKKVLTDPAASERYQYLIMERGRLQQTIQKAQQTLQP